MNAPAGITRRPSVCPHDCPSACALDVEVIDGSRIARVHGPAAQIYTAGRCSPARRDALHIVAEAFLKSEREFGAQSVWPYHYAGTMGLVMRDGIKRLTNSKRYSGFFSTICVNPAWTGFIAGTGVMRGPDPREMAKADCVVIWGTNAVSTQVNVMTHAMRARKERGAKIVVVDIYRNDTMKQADLALCLKPGTDGGAPAR